ncbi:MAG: hypothetical protein AAFY60_12025, partial [Myxococcota bacterium]
EKAQARAEDTLLARKFPETRQRIGHLAQFATRDTERVVVGDHVDVPASVRLSLTSTTAAVTATTQPSSLFMVPAALAAGGEWWMIGAALFSVSWPYFTAAAAQGAIAAAQLRPSGRPEVRDAALASAWKNTKLGWVQLIPACGIASTLTAITSQLQNRSDVRASADAAHVAGATQALAV